jgi:ABC-type lipoprotein release transport system permease subunit
MDAIENIALMALLMAVGVGISVAVLIGFLYYMEVQDDR